MFTGVTNWIENTAFPALTKCFSFFVTVITDLADNIMFSRLGFFFAIFLIGTAITTIIAIFNNAPDVSADGSYPQYMLMKDNRYSLLKPIDLYSSLSAGVFGRGFKLGRYISNKKKMDEFFQKNPSFIYMTKDGVKFFSKDWHKKKHKRRVR